MHYELISRKGCMKTVDLSKVHRVLIIRARAIGDVILTTPMIRAVRRALPDAEIDFLVEPFAEPALRGNPHLSNIVLLKRYSVKKELPNVRLMRKNELKNGGFFVRMIEMARFYAFVIGRKYDLVFDLWGNLRTAILSFLTGAKYRAGFNFRGRKYFYNLRVEPDVPPKYNVYYHMDLLKAAGIREDGGQTEFFTSAGDDAFADEFFRSAGIKPGAIGINGMGSWITKRWPPEKFAALIERLIAEDNGRQFVILWGPGELPLAEKISGMINNGKKNVIIAPETGIKQLGAIIKKLGILITNDGAPKHIAVATGTPTVTIYGPTNYRSWGPSGDPLHGEVHSGLPCAPCDRMGCEDKGIACMEKIGVEEVLARAGEVMRAAASLKTGGRHG
jgi:ADP-heptose:LPS heptosyltransferase